MKATKIRDLAEFRGHASLYKLDPPVINGDSKHEFVVVSAASTISGPETYIFPANEVGQITDWLELSGSFRGDLNHEQALSNAGYEVTA